MPQILHLSMMQCWTVPVPVYASVSVQWCNTSTGTCTIPALELQATGTDTRVLQNVYRYLGISMKKKKTRPCILNMDHRSYRYYRSSSIVTGNHFVLSSLLVMHHIPWSTRSDGGTSTTGSTDLLEYYRTATAAQIPVVFASLHLVNAIGTTCNTTCRSVLV